MRRIRLLIQYDGTDFCGWAEQRGRRTVQGTLKECIRRVGDEDVELRGASRTDSGAHALGMVADFATANPMPGDKWAKVLNRLLPKDVRIVKSSKTSMDFHSRFFARSRTYEYRISEQSRVEPLRARVVHQGGRKLDLARMREAISAIEGRNNFLAFGEELGIDNTVREVFSASVRRVRDEVRIRIEANAFIRGMMRRIAGGLFEVGRGKRSVEEFTALLDPERRDGLQWPVVLPAKGLTLLSVRYGRTMRDLRTENEERNT